MAAALCVTATLAVQPAPAHADRIRDRQWHLSFLEVAQAHQHSRGEGVTVAVVDSGVDPDHPDLRGNVLPGTDVIAGKAGRGNGLHPTDDHGTGMAGLIAAHGHGTEAGALGIAPKAKVLSILTAADRGYGADKASPEDIVAAIEFAVDQQVQVISLSVGVLRSASVRAAVDRARAADIVLVAASGNTSTDLFVPHPGAAEGVLTVGATSRKGNHAAISVSGPEVDLAAPGVDITTTARGDGYRTASGTSNSTAIVAGAVALVRAKYPDLSADEVIHRLTATATDKGPPGHDEEYGHGVLNLVAALTADVPPAASSAATPTASAVADPADPATADSAAPDDGPDAPSGTRTGLLVSVAVLAVLAAVVATFLVVRWRRRSS